MRGTRDTLLPALGSMPMPRNGAQADWKDRASALDRLAKRAARAARGGPPIENPSQLTFLGDRIARTGRLPEDSPSRILQELTEGDKRMLYEHLTSRVRSFAPDESGQLSLALEAMRSGKGSIADLNEADLARLMEEDAADELWSTWPERSKGRTWAPRKSGTGTLKTFFKDVGELGELSRKLGDATRAGDRAAFTELAPKFNKKLADSIMSAVRENVRPALINRVVLKKLDKDGLQQFLARIKHFQGQNRVAGLMASWNEKENPKAVRGLREALSKGQAAINAFEKGDIAGAVVRQRLSGLEAKLATGRAGAKVLSEKEMRETRGVWESLYRGLENLKREGRWLRKKTKDELAEAKAAKELALKDMDDGIVRSKGGVAHDEDFYSVSMEADDPESLARMADEERRAAADLDFRRTRGDTKFYEDLEIDRKMALQGVGGTGEEAENAARNLKRKLLLDKKVGERKLMLKLLKQGAFKQTGMKNINRLIDHATKAAEGGRGLPPEMMDKLMKAKLLRASTGFADLPKSEAEIGAIMQRLAAGGTETFDHVVKNPKVAKLLKTLFRL